MKKLVVLSGLLFIFAAAAPAQGPYAGYMTSDGSGNNRSVLIVNTVTGDFEVYDIDNKALNRKENIVYYDCVSYDRQTKTRRVHMVKIKSEE